MKTTELLWLPLLVPLTLSLGTQHRLRSTYRPYRRVRNHADLAGAEVARVLLDERGLQRVRIKLTPGSSRGGSRGLCDDRSPT